MTIAKSHHYKSTVLALLTCLALACGGGAAELGEDCETAASQDECVDATICTNEPDEAYTCRQSCVDQADCPSEFRCNGISGTTSKSCQPEE